jgi:hypothetical protein
MKAHLTLFFALLLLCTGASAVLAQGTPDWMTPHQETICDSESGAAFGLCNAYCEAMDCDSANPQASATACTKVKDKFTNITGRPLPCETCPPPPPGTPCPCVDLADFNLVLSTPGFCEEVGTVGAKLTEVGVAAATCNLQPPLGGGCGVITDTGSQVLNTTPEEGSACIQLILQSCNPV